MLKHAVEPDTKVFTSDDGPYFGLANQTWCFKNVVLLGANQYAFPDMMTAFHFRRTVYNALGIDLPVTARPPNHVVILDRQRKAPRRFQNIEDMKAIVRKYGMEPEYYVISNNSTFEEQVSLMSRAGVLITMHGAGLMNEIFMQPGSAVMEIFSVHHKHVLYERIAHYAGIYHFKVHVFAVNGFASDSCFLT
jgi:hypothetical protein